MGQGVQLSCSILDSQWINRAFTCGGAEVATVHLQGSRGRAVPYLRTRSSTSVWRSIATSMSLHGPEVRYRTPSTLCEIMGHWFLMDELRFGEAGEGVLSYQDLTRQDVEEEPTGTYLRRVLVRQYPLTSVPSAMFRARLSE